MIYRNYFSAADINIRLETYCSGFWWDQRMCSDVKPKAVVYIYFSRRPRFCFVRVCCCNHEFIIKLYLRWKCVEIYWFIPKYAIRISSALQVAVLLVFQVVNLVITHIYMYSYFGLAFFGCAIYQDTSWFCFHTSLSTLWWCSIVRVLKHGSGKYMWVLPARLAHYQGYFALTRCVISRKVFIDDFLGIIYLKFCMACYVAVFLFYLL